MNIILPEIVALGVYNSRVAVKNRSITQSRKTTMFEIELPIERGGISYINNEKAPIGSHMLICAKPGQSRHTKLPYKCYYIHMILREGVLYQYLMDLPNYIPLDDPQYYKNLFHKICLYYETGLESDEIRVQSLFLELIYSIIGIARKRQYREEIKSNNEAAIEKVLAFIKEHLNEELSLERIAEFAGFSPIHFHKCFKSATGYTLRQYVEERRIKKAANLLISTDQTLAEIAYECGFSSQSYFSYAFKRKMKSTPREYAREVLNRYSK